jgi:general secretion pathway protein N
VVAAGVQLAMPSAAALPEKPQKVAAQQTADESPRPAPQIYRAIMAHPIFAPDRAPPPVEADAAGNLNGVEVLGTAIAGSSAAAALVRDSEGNFTRLKVGEEIEGWKLVSIEPKELVFDRNGERRTLDLDVARLKSQATSTKPGAGANGATANTTTTTTDGSDDSDDSDDDQ